MCVYMCTIYIGISFYTLKSLLILLAKINKNYINILFINQFWLINPSKSVMAETGGGRDRSHLTLDLKGLKPPPSNDSGLSLISFPQSLFDNNSSPEKLLIGTQQQLQQQPNPIVQHSVQHQNLETPTPSNFFTKNPTSAQESFAEGFEEAFKKLKGTLPTPINSSPSASKFFLSLLGHLSPSGPAKNFLSQPAATQHQQPASPLASSNNNLLLDTGGSRDVVTSLRLEVPPQHIGGGGPVPPSSLTKNNTANNNNHLLLSAAAVAAAASTAAAAVVAQQQRQSPPNNPSPPNTLFAPTASATRGSSTSPFAVAASTKYTARSSNSVYMDYLHQQQQLSPAVTSVVASVGAGTNGIGTTTAADGPAALAAADFFQQSLPASLSASQIVQQQQQQHHQFTSGGGGMSCATATTAAATMGLVAAAAAAAVAQQQQQHPHFLHNHHNQQQHPLKDAVVVKKELLSSAPASAAVVPTAAAKCAGATDCSDDGGGVAAVDTDHHVLLQQQHQAGRMDGAAVIVGPSPLDNMRGALQDQQQQHNAIANTAAGAGDAHRENVLYSLQTHIATAAHNNHLYHHQHHHNHSQHHHNAKTGGGQKGGGGGGSDTGEQDMKKLERKRARNRLAASKCRQRKLQRIMDLEQQVSEEKERGAELQVQIGQLQSVIRTLEERLMKAAATAAVETTTTDHHHHNRQQMMGGGAVTGGATPVITTAAAAAAAAHRRQQQQQQQNAATC